MNRACHLALAVALVTVPATPLAAQNIQLSERTTFLQAVRNGDGATVQSMANDPSSGVINAGDAETGERALHILVRQRNLRWIAYLMSRGARPDVQANDGTTPLGLAAQLGWREGAEQLLARGAQVDLANRRGETPLILAVQASHLATGDRLDIVRLLIGRGADPNRQDSYAGYSALDYARRDGRSSDIVRALEERPARAAAMPGPTP